MALNVFDDGYLEDETYVELARKVFDTVTELMGEDGVCADLTTVSEDEIREVNAETRGVDAVTDVLSFPTIEGGEFPLSREEYSLDVDPESGELMLGEILLCVKRCREQGEEYGHGFKREFAYLVAHGCLHLYGFDHMVEDEKKEMRKMEEAVMTALNVPR